MKKIFFYILLFIPLIIFSFIALIFLSAFIDWEANKEILLSNLDEFHKIVISKDKRGSTIQLDEYGKVVEITPTRIYDRNNIVIGEFYSSRREIVGYDEIPEILIKTVIAIEDRRFYNHRGIDYKGIIRAIFQNIKAMKVVAGGSTITQQLAKVLLTSRKRTLHRKLIELFGALSIEKRYTKDDILLMYLNTVYLGHGSYGIGSACRLYFNKNVSEITFYEAALLVGIISRPNYYSPIINQDKARKKQAIVLSIMKKLNFISSEAKERGLSEFWRNYNEKLTLPNVSFWRMTKNLAPYFNEYIRQQLLNYFTVEQILLGGLNIYTSLDINYQSIAERECALWFKQVSKQYKGELPQIALVAVEPSTGYLLSMIGGNNYTFQNQLNRAINISRPIGSLIKPFIYAVAIESKNFNELSIMEDKPLKYGRWQPQNYDGKFIGPVILRDALKKSINSVAIQLLEKIGIDNLFLKFDLIFNSSVHKRFPRNLTCALGNIELSPLEVAISYSTLANGGKNVSPLMIRNITDSTGNVLISFENEPKNKTQVFSRGTAFVINKMLQDVLRQGGTGWEAAKHLKLLVPYGAKTGTTDLFRDAWFVAYTSGIVSCVWVGFDNSINSLGSEGTGGKIAAPVCLQFINKVSVNIPFKDFVLPEDEAVLCNICLDTGALATLYCKNIGYDYAFLKGTEPTYYCNTHRNNW